MRLHGLTFRSTLLATAVCASFATTPEADASSCSDAARTAELSHALPAGLLTAIGSVESGGWGLSVNGNDGTPGRRFATTRDAIQYTAILLGSGVTTIDIGCFQVDLHYHANAFQRWQDAFDEDLNAGAAADILSRLHAHTGNWARAVQLYHSADPDRGQAYLQAVMSAWRGDPVLSSFVTQSDDDKAEFRSAVVPVVVWGPVAAINIGRTGSFHSSRLPRVITP